MPAMDDDPTSVNYELRTMGMRGDDDDDVEEDRVEVFGNTSDIPIHVNVDDDDPPVDDSGNGTPTGSSATCTNKKTKTSKVWDDFEELYETTNGNRVRVSAKCNYCHKTLSARSSAGTGHLLRHIKSCKPRKLGSNALPQSMLRFSADGSVIPWEYSPEVARFELCRLIAREDLPISFGQSPAFVNYIKAAHNPRFVPVSRQTTTRDFYKLFKDRRSVIIDRLNSASSIALTSDIWSGHAKEDYLSVVAHFVSSDWQLEKRVLGLRLHLLHKLQP